MAKKDKSKIKSICRKIGLVVLTIVLLFVGFASATIFSAFWSNWPHVPHVLSDQCGLDQPGCQIILSGSKQGFYSELQTDQVGLFQVELNKDEQIDLRLVIPNEILSGVRVPILEIAGPGLSQRGQQAPEYLPDSIYNLDQIGSIEYTKTSSDPWQNSVSHQEWIVSQHAQFEAPESGIYYIAVYDTLGEPGGFALIFDGKNPSGVSEMFGLVIGTIRLMF